MIVGVPRESYPGERRVALVPGVVPGLLKAGLQVVVEAGAGVEAGYPDADYTARGGAGAARGARMSSATADIIVQVLCHGSNDRTGSEDLPLTPSGSGADRLPAAAGIDRDHPGHRGARASRRSPSS